jgi:DNA polymerase-1
VTIDVDTGEERVFIPRAAQCWKRDEHADAFGGAVHYLDELPAYLSGADELIGHNIASFDVPVLERFNPGWKRTDRFYDTRAASRQIYFANLLERTIKFRRAAGRSEEAQEARYPRRLLAPNKLHTLEAWGWRLGLLKGSLISDEGVQEEYSDRLLEYCLRDVRVNVKLFHRLTTAGADFDWPVTNYEAMVVESRCLYLLHQQEANGVRFNEAAAHELHAKLAGRRDVVARELREKHFPAWWAPAKKTVKNKEPLDAEVEELLPNLRLPEDCAYEIPARTYKVKYPHQLAGRAKGCPFTPVELVEFNPGSDHHIADRLQKVHGWVPKAWTDTGLPKVDEEVLSDLSYPSIPLLLEYAVLDKRLGALAEGKSAWLKKVKADGRIHGAVLVTGARTTRMSHFGPNLAQVPRVGSPYGAECRALFGPTRPGWLMTGTDAAGLELRALAHRLAFYDCGAFAKVVLDGDPHTEWMKASGIFIRNNQKTCTYGFIYGAGDEKLGLIRIADWREAYQKGITPEKPPALRFAKSLGAEVRSGLLRQVAGLETLMKATRRAYQRGWLLALDGRVIAVKSEHGALNDLLQSDGAIIMKHALVLRSELALSAGLVCGSDWHPLLNIHDEWQDEARTREVAERLGQISVEAIRKAGEKLSFRCPLDGEFKIGTTWAETH